MADEPREPTPTPYRLRVGLALGIVLSLITAGVIAAQIHPGTSGKPNDPASGGSGTQITVTGSGTNGSAGGANVSYGGLSGTQSGHQDLPFTTTITEAGPVSVVAQADEYTYTIGCTITRGGNVVASKSSTGQFAVVSCAG